MTLSALFLFIIILLVLVIVHECGHFLAAKFTGMRVDEFAAGFPPRLFAKKYGETTYALNALPLGGYVSIYGENGDPDDKARHDPRAFNNRPVWAKLLTLAAGVIMNMALAFVIFIGISYGDVLVTADDQEYGSRITSSYIMVTDAHPESPAYKAGIVPGSTITSIATGVSRADMSTATSAVGFIARNANSSFTISYIQPNKEERTTVVAAVYGLVPDRKALGISLEEVGIVQLGFFEAITTGVERTISMTVLTLGGLYDLIASVARGESVIESLSGPVGIAKIVGNTSEYGVTAVLTLVAVLSINLAIFNALPIPALDGGRFLIVIGEAIVRKRVPHTYMALANGISFMLLILLIIVVTVKDVTM